MKKYIIISLTLLFGLFSMARGLYASEQNEQILPISSCCDQGHKTEAHHCCQSEGSHNHDHKGHCDGKCKSPSCQQNGLKFQLFLTVENACKWSDLSTENTSFYGSTDHVVAGFISIWLPPKIN